MDGMDAPLKAQATSHRQARRHRHGRHRRAFPRDPPGGGAGRSVTGHRLGRENTHDLRRAFRQRIRRGRFGGGLGKMDAGRINRVGLDALADLVHHLHRFDGIVSGGAFGGKHDRVGAFINGIGDVADFRAGRGWRDNHRLQHLGRHDDRLSGLASRGDDPVLRRRHAFGREFHAEITACHHDSVNQVNDLVQPIERLRLLDLGEEAGLVADEFTCLGDILGPLDE